VFFFVLRAFCPNIGVLFQGDYIYPFPTRPSPDEEKNVLAQLSSSQQLEILPSFSKVITKRLRVFLTHGVSTNTPSRRHRCRCSHGTGHTVVVFLMFFGDVNEAATRYKVKLRPRPNITGWRDNF